MNIGRLWEAVNLASVWSLPLIVVVENNQYAVETHVDRVTGGGDIVRRARGFGLPAVRIDGQDVVAVHKVIAMARTRATAGEGPTFVEAVTYRYFGHNTGEVARYRTQDEVQDWRSQRDPIDRVRGRGRRAGRRGRRGVRGPGPSRSPRRHRERLVEVGALATGPVDGDAQHRRLGHGAGAMSPDQPTFSEAFQQGVREEMTRNDDIFVLGTDLFDRGGHFAQVKGIGPEFGAERVRDTPISEAAMVAAGVGAAMYGLHPIVDLNFIDFAFGAMDEIVNQAAKIRFMLGRPVPLLIRATHGVALGGAHHQNSLEAWFMHTPGLAVAVPSTAYDAKGLVKTALRSSDPVIFLMHKRLSGIRGDVGGPEDLVPFGKARVARPGDDCTIVTYGGTVAPALRRRR